MSAAPEAVMPARGEIPAVTFHGVYSPEDCERICALGRDGGAKDADILGAPREHRSCLVAFLTDQALNEQILKLAGDVNEHFFGFQLSGVELPQYTAYATGDHYGWHMDKGPDTKLRRKLSFVVQLSKPEDYEGGALELLTGAEAFAVSREQGAVCAFPSWLIHRVTPVTRGVRRSLVIWAHGEPFR